MCLCMREHTRITQYQDVYIIIIQCSIYSFHKSEQLHTNQGWGQLHEIQLQLQLLSISQLQLQLL